MAPECLTQNGILGGENYKFTMGPHRLYEFLDILKPYIKALKPKLSTRIDPIP